VEVVLVERYGFLGGNVIARGTYPVDNPQPRGAQHGAADGAGA
jgi:hypothetical protein